MAIGSSPPFYPQAQNTVSITANSTSQSILLNGAGETCMIYANTTGVAFVSFDTNLGITANASTSMPIPANSRMLVQCSPMPFANVSVAVILPSGTGTVYFTRGTGSSY